MSILEALHENSEIKRLEAEAATLKARNDELEHAARGYELTAQALQEAFGFTALPMQCARFAIEHWEALKARCEELEAAIDALSLRCGFPIVEDRKQLLETVGNKVERLEADRERLQAANRLIDRALAGVDPKWIADAGN